MVNRKGVSLTFSTLAVLLIVLITAALTIVFLRTYFIKSTKTTEVMSSATEKLSDIETAYALLQAGNVREACEIIKEKRLCDDLTNCRIKDIKVNCESYEILP